ncbi:uncharacterized protein LOC129613835 [Condylostylus longicornis]|uniref:uncharacterized protein LOC129613835 n=1 Tax=Condylostylus longicornis TaxID=2530218 RepID=UPI00244E05C6|nr:uncharacterized protein LOC129613835 [Condylostylus longicornis]
MRPFSEILKDHLVVAVVEQAQEDGRISAENWRKVESRLMAGFPQIMNDNPGPYPLCRDQGWHQGFVKLVACADGRSLDLYKKAIAGVGEVWPGARLAVVAKDQIPSKPRSRAWIPAEPSSTDTILEMIKLGNPNLPAGPHNNK